LKLEELIQESQYLSRLLVGKCAIIKVTHLNSKSFGSSHSLIDVIKLVKRVHLPFNGDLMILYIASIDLLQKLA